MLSEVVTCNHQRVQTQGGTRNRTRDLRKRGSAFITSSDHWTEWVKASSKSSRRRAESKAALTGVIVEGSIVVVCIVHVL